MNFNITNLPPRGTKFRVKTDEQTKILMRKANLSYKLATFLGKVVNVHHVGLEQESSSDEYGLVIHPMVIWIRSTTWIPFPCLEYLEDQSIPLDISS